MARATLKVGDKEIPLYFGMMAVEEIANRQQTGRPGWFKLLTDLIYAGYINAITLSDVAPEYNYRQIGEMIDPLLADGDPQIGEIFTVFRSTQAGQKIEEAIEDLKKKTSQAGTQ